MTHSQKSEAQIQSPSSGKTDYEHLEISDALKLLGVDPKSGLSDVEAAKRLEKYGPNALPEKKVSTFEMFGKFFWGPMPWMIEAAAIMSILVKDLIDFIIIMVMLHPRERLLFSAAVPRVEILYRHNGHASFGRVHGGFRLARHSHFLGPHRLYMALQSRLAFRDRPFEDRDIPPIR